MRGSRSHANGLGAARIHKGGSSMPETVRTDTVASDPTVVEAREKLRELEHRLRQLEEQIAVATQSTAPESAEQRAQRFLAGTAESPQAQPDIEVLQSDREALRIAINEQRSRISTARAHAAIR